MTNFWAGFEKQAKASDEEENKARRRGHAKAIAFAGVGAHQLGKSLDPLTGRISVYHGTSSTRADAIRRRGLDPKHGGTGTSKGDARYEPNSKGKVHVTDLKSVAKLYSDPESYEAASKGNKTGLKEHWKMLKTTVKPAGRGVVKASLPYEDFRKNFKEDAYSNPKTRAYLSSSRIEPHHIRGGAGYRKQQLKELKNIGSYIAKHPGRFAGGLGRAAIGVAGLGYAAHHAVKSLSKHPEDRARSQED